MTEHHTWAEMRARSVGAICESRLERLGDGLVLRDPEVPGLFAIREAHGTTYVLYFRLPAESFDRRAIIGPHPGTALAEARGTALDCLRAIRAGDPAPVSSAPVARLTEEDSAWTVRAAATVRKAGGAAGALTSQSLASATPGKTLRDKTIPGLHAKVTAGSKTFYLYFRTKAGVERRPKIGTHPLMTVAQARAIAKDMLLEVAKGNDPSAQRQAERLAPTVSEAIDKYEKEHAPKRKSGAAAVKLLRAHLERKLGSEKVAAIDHGHMHALHASMAKTPILANRAVQHASKLFSLCELWKFRTPDQVNPCRGIERFPEKKRKRYMTPAEAKAVADALDKYKAEFPQAVAYIYLLILTGTRRGEIWEARWEWLDGNVLRLPDSKTGAKDVFLPPPAMEIINQLPRTNGTITGIGPPYKLWYKVRKEAGCPDLRLHDLRHSFASAALAQGLTLEQIGELLGHASTQTTKRYAHLVDATAHAAAARTASAVLADMKGVTA